MTLITRLSGSFTDTTLPILQRDPVLPTTGARILLDFKNGGTWNQSDSTINKTDPIYSLTKTAIPDGTSPGIVRQGGSDVDGVLHLATMNYNATTGRVTFPTGDATAGASQSTRYLEQNSSFYIINDLTAGYCLSMWVYVDIADASTRSFLVDTNEGSDSNRRGIVVSYQGNSKIFSVWKPSASGFPVNATTNASSMNFNGYDTPTISTSGIYRIGYAWYKTGGVWRFRGVFNNTLATEQNMVGFDTTGYDAGQLTHDGARVATRNWGIGRAFSNKSSLFGSSHGIYRLYVENLTLSGRTPEQVWAADWARGNGRFS